MYFKLVSAKKDNEPNLDIPVPDCYKCEGNRCDKVLLELFWFDMVSLNGNLATNLTTELCLLDGNLFGSFNSNN